MAIQTLADWNAANESAWIAWGQRRSYLIERTYIRDIINAGGFATSGTCDSPAEAFEQLHRARQTDMPIATIIAANPPEAAITAPSTKMRGA